MIILKSKYFNTPINTPDSSQEEKKKGMNPVLAGSIAAAGAGIGSRVVIGAGLRPFERILWNKHNKKSNNLQEELNKEKEEEVNKLKQLRDIDDKKVRDAEQEAYNYGRNSREEQEEFLRKKKELLKKLKPFDEYGFQTANYEKYKERLAELEGLNVYNEKEYEELSNKYKSLVDEVSKKHWNNKIVQAGEEWDKKADKALQELFEKTERRSKRIDLIGKKIAPVVIGLGTGALVYNRYRNKKKKEEN